MGKMSRNFTSSSFSSSGFESESDSDSDPRVGLVNLADVMLVFACGLMLALVAYWNLDISSMQELTQGKEVKEVQNLEQMQDNFGEGGGGFVELGKVYQDPMTGKYYMLQEDIEKSEESGDENNDSASDASGETNGNTNDAGSGSGNESASGGE